MTVIFRIAIFCPNFELANSKVYLIENYIRTFASPPYSYEGFFAENCGKIIKFLVEKNDVEKYLVHK